jgi:hypothetical protein
MDENVSMGFIGYWIRYLLRTTVFSVRLVWVYVERVRGGFSGERW